MPASTVRIICAISSEVIRPDRQARRRRGKSDAADAVAAALAALNGEASGVPKSHDGAAEPIRMLRVVRCGAVKARTQAANHGHGMTDGLRGTQAAALAPGGRGQGPRAFDARLPARPPMSQLRRKICAPLGPHPSLQPASALPVACTRGPRTWDPGQSRKLTHRPHGS
jgi:hypothetical protein